MSLARITKIESSVPPPLSVPAVVGMFAFDVVHGLLHDGAVNLAGA
jgi:hypothetical protein